MSALSAGQGMVPVNHPSGLTRPFRLIDGITAATTQTFRKGTPVLLDTTGVIVPISDVTWDAAADDLYGVFDGVEYTDAEGRRRERNSWTGPITGATDIWAYVWVDPDIVYEVQANGSLAATSVGDQANFAATESGSSITGISNMQISTTLVGAGVQGYVRIIGLSNRPGNAWGDAFTFVNVQIAAHQFVADKVAI